MSRIDRRILRMNINELKRSKLYSEELGISLKKNIDGELFKWFLASVLFGARISEKTAKKTYRTFEKYDLLEPNKILKKDWEFLVNTIMKEGGYVRYDGKTSTQILRNCETLMREYGGSLKRLHEEAGNSEDLENRLINFYGIGPTTTNIFMRELRPYWKKSNPEPMPIVKKIAQKYGIDLDEYRRKSIDFVRIEAGLIRLRRSLNR